MKRFSWAWVLPFLAGCGRTIFTPLEGDPTAALPGEAPTAGKAEFCVAGADGSFPLEGVTIAEKRWDGKAAVARGGGCVGRSLRDAWAALHAGEALHWNGADLLDFARVLPVPDERVLFLFQSKYQAGPPVFRQKWTMQWFHSRKDEGIFVRFKKTEGTSFIPRWDGTIELVPVAKAVTGFAMRNEIEASRTGLDESEGSVRDQLSRIRTTPADYTYLGEEP